MKLGRFIIDTHVHAQRHAAGPEFKKSGKTDLKKIKYNDLASIMRHLVTYDNSKRLLYDMECYQVDMCILHPAFGMSNELNVDLVERYPDKFVALVSAKDLADKATKGEAEWSIEAACEELDRHLSTGKFVGIGEGMPANPTRKKTYSQTERMDELRKVMEVAQKHQVPVRVHTGSPMGYHITYTRWPENFHPNWIRDIATEYPDVPIIFDHGGMQGGRWDTLVLEGLPGNGSILDGTLLRGPQRPQCGCRKTHVGNGLGGQYTDTDPNRSAPPDFCSPGQQRRACEASGGRNGVEP